MSVPEGMVEEGCVRTAHGAILIDRARLEQVGAEWLDPAHWGAVGERSRGGRGEVWFVDTPCGAAVLRHYRRGGLIARVNRDRYLWTGAARTRAFAEFRLLAELLRRGLPVPRPLVAGYRRHGLTYTADILVARIDGAVTLAERLAPTLADLPAMHALGATLGRFHAAGVSHADLNAHNLLRDADGRWWLIDFDRGHLRAPQVAWQQQRLARLQRSLEKLGAAQVPAFRAGWQALCDGHDAVVGQPA